MNAKSIAEAAGFSCVEAAERFPALGEALRLLVKNDSILLDRGAHERTICHRLAVYLEGEVNRDLDGSNRWHIDCEYNLFGSDQNRQAVIDNLRKHMPIQGRHDRVGKEVEHSVFPDVIVHHRDKPHNELVLEVKVVRGRPDRNEIEFDLRKLTAFTALGNGFGYRHALFMTISPSMNGSLAKVEVFASEGTAQ
jgi:hypothetical protein